MEMYEPRGGKQVNPRAATRRATPADGAERPHKAGRHHGVRRFYAARDARKMRGMARHPALLVVIACALLLPGKRATAADQVTIYRCTDAGGKLTLRDTPCAKGQKQQTRSMLRPKDAPARVVRKSRPVHAPMSTETTRVIVVNAPRPLYECATPDGERYVSDTADGSPRWVPLWTLGYPVLVEAPIFTPGGGHVRYRDGRVDAGFRSGGVRHGVVPTPAGYGAGTWVRDECHALPQVEVCDRLVDRRSELRRRFFNAMPSERDVIRVEERGINARLDNDCGIG